MYEKTKAKYATSGALKKADFKAAVEQIEAAVKGDDPAPNSYEVRSGQNLDANGKINKF